MKTLGELSMHVCPTMLAFPLSNRPVLNFCSGMVSVVPVTLSVQWVLWKVPMHWQREASPHSVNRISWTVPVSRIKLSVLSYV